MTLACAMLGSGAHIVYLKDGNGMALPLQLPRGDQAGCARANDGLQAGLVMGSAL